MKYLLFFSFILCSCFFKKPSKKDILAKEIRELTRSFAKTNFENEVLLSKSEKLKKRIHKNKDDAKNLLYRKEF